METNEEQVVVAKKTTRKRRHKLLNFMGLTAFTVAIFALGWISGHGGIRLKTYSPVSSNSSLPADLDYDSVETIYDSLRENFEGELDEAKLIDGIKSGLAKATGDPYTEFFNPDAAEEFNNGLEGTFEGIGAELGKDAENNIIIVSPIAGYPAEKAGLRPKDIVAEIDGETAYDLNISEAVDKIRGEKGTQVKLTLVREGQPIEVTITRETITIDSVKTDIRDGVGIMTISRFGDDTVGLAQKAARELKAAGVKAIILDLRGNPGGYLDAAVDVSSLWLDKGATVLTERRDNVVVDTMTAKGDPILKGIKTIVLINEGSASASEIVAGALQDNKAATLLGQKSFGKGSVQQPINLGDGGLLKVTVARWFTPGGKNIDKEGISPDQTVELTSDDISADRDPQLDAALSALK